MNKFYTLLLLSGAALSVNAQQINGSFDAEWGKCVPWTSKGNTNAVGTTPEGWAISNVYISKGITATVGSEIEGNNGGKAVKLTNINAAGQAVPAYIATIAMPFMYSISEGISMGVISYVIINICTGAVSKKQISPVVYILAVIFILKYIFV